MKLHTSLLETIFVYTLALSMPIFKKKSLRGFLKKMPKLFIVVTLYTKKVPFCQSDLVTVSLSVLLYSTLVF